MKTLLLFLGVALWSPAVAPGRDYYLRPDGSDQADGKSDAGAWATLEKLNATPLTPGDRVHLKRGGRWFGRLEPKVLRAGDGTDRNAHVTFDAYGTGPKPVLSGRRSLDPKAFEPLGGNVYAIPYKPVAPVDPLRAELGTKCGAVLVGGVLVPRRASLAELESSRKGYWYESSRLFIGCAADPRGGAVPYEICEIEDLINLRDTDHVTFRDIVVDGSALPPDGYGIRIGGATDVLVENCEAYRGWKHNIGFINCDGLVARGLRASEAVPGLGDGMASAFVAYSDRNKKDRYLLEDCTAERYPGTKEAGSRYDGFLTHGAQGQGPAEVILKGFQAIDCSVTLNNAENREGVIQMKGGRIVNSVLNLLGKRSVADGVRIEGPACKVTLGEPEGGSGATLQNCLLVGCDGANDYKCAIKVVGAGAVIRFNTVVIGKDADPWTAAVAYVLASAAPSEPLSCYGNIFANRSANAVAYSDWTDGAEAHYRGLHHNLYLPGTRMTHKSGTSKTFEEWKTATRDVGSLLGVPAFEGPSDYRLGKDSPGVDAFKGRPEEVPGSDFANAKRPKGARADLGCFESH